MLEITEVEGLSGHIVILGWSARVQRIIKELRSEEHETAGDSRPIVVVSPSADVSVTNPFERVYIVHGSVQDPAVLERAHLRSAASLLIPALRTEGPSPDGDNVFSLLAALTVNPKVRICVEVAKAENGEILEQIRRSNLRGGEIEIVSFELVSERLLAQAAVNRGVTAVYNHLLQFNEGNELHVVDLGGRWVGATFAALAAACFDKDAIAVGYERAGELYINPRNRKTVLEGGDRLWLIAYDKLSCFRIVNPDALLTA